MQPPTTRCGRDLVAALCQKYALGHPEIDAQHRRIFEIVAQTDERTPTATILDELYAYAAFHFTAEERIAEEHNVDTDEHAAAHYRLLDRIARYRVETAGSAVQVRRFLVE